MTVPFRNRATQELLDILANSTKSIERVAAASALGERQAAEVSEATRKALKDENIAVRIAAARATASADPESSPTPIIEALELAPMGSPPARHAAQLELVVGSGLHLLTHFPGRAVLAAALRDAPSTAILALRAARELPADDQLSLAVAALEHASPDVRRQAVTLLRDLETPHTQELLSRALDDRNWRVRRSAKRAIAAIQGRP